MNKAYEEIVWKRCRWQAQWWQISEFIHFQF